MARRKPKGIVDNIADYAKSVTNVFDRRQRPMETRQVTQARNVTRSVVQTGASAADMYFTGGLAGSLRRNVVDPKAGAAGMRQFAKDAAVVVGTAGVARGVVKGVQAARNVNRARQAVLFHGGPANLKGGVINPSIVGPGTARTNRGQLDSFQGYVSGYPQRMRNIAGDAQQTIKAKAPISKKIPRLQQLGKAAIKETKSTRSIKKWTDKANKNNYFTAVREANEAYVGSGAADKYAGWQVNDRAIHVIRVPQKNVMNTFSREYGINKKVKPAASVPSGKTPSEFGAAIGKASRIGKELQKPVTISDSYTVQATRGLVAGGQAKKKKNSGGTRTRGSKAATPKKSSRRGKTR